MTTLREQLEINVRKLEYLLTEHFCILCEKQFIKTTSKKRFCSHKCCATYSLKNNRKKRVERHRVYNEKLWERKKGLQELIQKEKLMLPSDWSSNKLLNTRINHFIKVKDIKTEEELIEALGKFTPNLGNKSKAAVLKRLGLKLTYVQTHVLERIDAEL